MIKNLKVFHYTSIDVFRCLIESVMKSTNHDAFCFFASNILYMNDPNEFILGGKVFARTIRKIEDELDIKDSQRISLLWSNMSNGQKEYIAYMQERNELPYVVSFSSLEDSLPMWLNYGDKGKGVCLAFNFDSIFQELRFKDFIPSPYNYLSEVCYNTITKQSKLYKTLFQIMHSYKQDVFNDKYEDTKGIYFNALIQYAAPLVKSKFYRNEHEIRLIQTVKYNYEDDVSRVGFRCNSKGNIIPYIPIEIYAKYLDYTIIGPCAEFDLTRKALEMMKAKYNLEFEIKKSNVQYRNY